MKLTLPKKELKEALLAMSKILVGKSSLPILSAVKINASKSSVFVSGTDLEQSLTWIIKNTEGNGSFIVNLKELKDFLKNGDSSSKNVELERMGKNDTAICYPGNIDSVKSITTFPEKDWPNLPGSSTKGKKISADVFTNIQKAIPSASTDDTRRLLQSVLLEKDAVIATNGHELVKLRCQTGAKGNAILPVTKFIKSRYFTGNDGTVSVEEKDDIKCCAFVTENWVYTTKCIYGTYPNYQQVIPKTNESSIELSTETIASLQESIPGLESDENFQTIHLYADDKQIKFLPSNYTGKALMVDGVYKGNTPITISINRTLLLRALSLGFTKLRFTDGDGYAPILSLDTKGLYVFMPLRGVDAEKIRVAVKMSGSNTVTSKHGSDKALEFHGKKPKPHLKDTEVDGKQQERSVESSIKKEDKKMQEETKNRTQGFHVVGEPEKDHFEELLTSIMDVRVKAKEVFDMTGTLTKHVKDAQKAQKTKEREFKNTRDLLGKLKKVSGF